MDQILGEIAKQGPLGLILAWFIWNNMKLSGRLEEIQDKRITESRECMQAMHTTATAVEANTKATEALSQLIRDQRRSTR